VIEREKIYLWGIRKKTLPVIHTATAFAVLTLFWSIFVQAFLPKKRLLMNRIYFGSLFLTDKYK